MGTNGRFFVAGLPVGIPQPNVSIGQDDLFKEPFPITNCARSGFYHSRRRVSRFLERYHPEDAAPENCRTVQQTMGANAVLA